MVVIITVDTEAQRNFGFAGNEQRAGAVVALALSHVTPIRPVIVSVSRVYILPILFALMNSWPRSCSSSVVGHTVTRKAGF